MMGLTSVALTVLCIFVSISAQPDHFTDGGTAILHGSGNQFASTLDAKIPVLLKTQDVPGLAVGVIDKGRVLFVRAYGLADRESGSPLTVNSVMGVASLSKPVTAWGVMHFVEKEKMSIDAPVCPLLHRWTLPPSQFDSNGVTIKRLLSHTAGTSVLSVPWFPANSKLPTLETVLRGEAAYYRDFPERDRGPVKLVREPGSKWAYSGGGYTILQLLIEERSGLSFDNYMKSFVFNPLGMMSTSYSPNADLSKRIVSTYDEEGRKLPQFHLIGEAAGNLFTTIHDFTGFLTAYTSAPGKIPGRHIISPAALKMMATPVAKVELQGVDTDDAQYGLGHGVHRTANGATRLYHSGGNPGVVAYFLVTPSEGNGMVVISNSSKAVSVVKDVLKLWAEYYHTDLEPVY